MTLNQVRYIERFVKERNKKKPLRTCASYLFYLYANMHRVISLFGGASALTNKHGHHIPNECQLVHLYRKITIELQVVVFENL